MKKIFTFAIVFAAAAMISCAGNANQAAAEVEAEAAAVECCGECAAEKADSCCGKAECQKGECDKAECKDCTEKAEAPAEQKAE